MKIHKKSNVIMFSLISLSLSLILSRNTYAASAVKASKVKADKSLITRPRSLECPPEEVDNNLTPNRTYYGTLSGGRLESYIGKTLYFLSPREEVVGCGLIEELSDNLYGYRFTRALGTVLPEWGYGYTFNGMKDGEDVTFVIDNNVVETSISPVIWHPDYNYVRVDLLLPRNFINK